MQQPISLPLYKVKTLHIMSLVLLYPELLRYSYLCGKAEEIKDNIMMKVDNN
jgi:hypothetical protein